MSADRWIVVFDLRDDIEGPTYGEGPYTEQQAMDRRAWLWDHGDAGFVQLCRYNGVHVVTPETDSATEVPT